VKLRPATQAAYSASMKRLRGRWDRFRLDDITVEMAAGYISETERPYKGSTIKGDMTVLGRVLDFASRYLGWMGRTPFRGPDKSKRPKLDERPKRILSSAELARLTANVDAPYRLLFEFAAATGCRLVRFSDSGGTA
jgi:integrase